MKLEFNSIEEVLEFVNKSKIIENVGKPIEQNNKSVKQDNFVTIDCDDYKLMVSDGRGDSYQNGNKAVNFYQVQQWIDENYNKTKLGGYDDWILPTKDELNLLYENKDLFQGHDAFSVNLYWSSSECLVTNAWVQNFYNGSRSYYGKMDYYYVRAVRRINP